MNDAGGAPTGAMEFQALLFTVGETRMAVDAEQVERVVEMDAPEGREIGIVEIPGARGARTGEKGGHMLVIRNGRTTSGIAIDSLDHFETLTSGQIRLLPAVIENSHVSRVFRGAALVNGEIILLADLSGLKQAGPGPE